MNTKTVHKRAVIFLRARHRTADGNDRAAEERLIAAQRDRCMTAAAKLGADVIREYVEHGGTGSINKRPELRLMLEELRALHDVDYVIVTSMDRLCRKVADAEAIRFELDATGAELVMAAGGEPVATVPSLLTAIQEVNQYA